MNVDDLCFHSARELRAMIDRRSVSVREVMSAHLAQIERINPQVNAIVSLVGAEQALQMADNSDRMLAAGEPTGLLHGLPHAVKDLHDAAGLPNTSGSPIYRNRVSVNDALIVERIRAAGALIIGKTNVPEFGLGSHTYNPVFGPTRNPYDLTKSAGGSSGGAGAALATGMLPLADGSDMGGSLRNPGNFNNIVGFRVSPGLVPSWPTSSPWMGLSVKGPMARTVADTAWLLSVMAGPDDRDQSAFAVDTNAFRLPLDRDFRGVRIAWCPDLGGLPLDHRVRETLHHSRHVFESLGCVVEDASPDLTGAEHTFQVLRAGLLAGNDAELLERHRDQIKPEAIWNIEKGLAITASEFVQAMSTQEEIFQRLRVFMQQYEFIICAVNQVPPFPIEWHYPTHIDGVAMDNYISWMQSAYFITVTRSPAISVPAGFTTDQLPVGAQIVGRFRDDLGVLQLAHAFEQATGFYKVRPTIVSA